MEIRWGEHDGRRGQHEDGGGEEIFRGEIDRDIKEMATVRKIDDNILGAMAAMGEAELTGDPIEVGDSGMATALESFTARIGGKDSGLKGRGIPEREQ
jgi:hypothetical protein